MTGRDTFAAALIQHRLVAILRGVSWEALLPLANTLVDAGVRLMEVALSNPNDVGQIAELRTNMPAEVLVGAGTVTDARIAASAREAGASFLVTPGVHPEVITYANEHALGLLCGALTPTEIHHARSLGARFIKLFPASVMGPEHVRALLGPFPDVEMVVVGGVGSKNLGAFLEAGALGAGVGGALVPGVADDDGLQKARLEAMQLVEALAGVPFLHGGRPT